MKCNFLMPAPARVFGLLAPALVLAASAPGMPVINEIMYRPGTGYPENTGLEFVEIHNPDAVAVDLSGWALTKGVDFVFPAGATLEAGGYLVVSPDPSALQASAGITGVLGPWEAGDKLSNNGETVTLSQPDGAGGWIDVDTVDYADEGDFAVRTRDALGGWSWVAGASASGRSLERRNPALSVNSGQNWGDSTAAGGTPGRANSLVATNIAPVITKLRHFPAVPKSTDAVTISCQLTDEANAGSLMATLHWRNATSASPGAFQSVVMANNGAGFMTATLPALADKQIVEFYVSAADGTLTRTWPAPTSEGQNANAAYQVDNEVITGAAPAYRLILTASENAAFAAVASSSNRQFNVTLVATRGGDATIRYGCSMRIRGFSSRNYTFKPLRFSLPSDNRWSGVREFNLNPKYPWVTHLANKAVQAAGLAAADTTPVELRRNGVESTTGSSNAQDHGKWVRVEPLSSDYVDRHWPAAADGQVYRKESSTYWSAGGSAPTNPDGSYSGWTKKNHQAANDWSDVMNFTTIWQNTAASHFTGATAGNVQSGTWNNVAFSDTELETLSTVADLDHMARWFAIMTIINNGEPNIANGGREDADYAGAFISDGVHRRLQLLGYDLDASFGQGEESRTATTGGLYPMTTPATGGGGRPGGGSSTGFEPLLPLFGNTTTAGNAAFRAKYLGYLRELMGTVLDADTTGNSYPSAYAFIDNHLADWAPASVRTSMKTYMTQRQSYLLGLIGQGKIAPAPTAQSTLAQAATGALRLNEVLASNTAAHANGMAFPDVIEIYNSGGGPIDLAGYSLSDDAADPRKYVFPGGVAIAAGGYLLVYADSSAIEQGLHTGFGLSAAGDSIFLYEPAASGGTLVDSLTFGPQIADFSLSRTSDDASVWALTMPTIGAANGNAAALASTASLRLNEWSGQQDYRVGDDFVEIYNTVAQPAALGGVRITDHRLAYPDRYAFPALSFIAGQGLLALTGDDLGFGLDGMFEDLFLLGSNGGWIDQADCVSQFPDHSTGRSTDGGAAWADFAYPTPGLPNATVLPAAHLALLNSLCITEIMFQPPGGSSYEFIELQNIGGAELDLGGVRFTEGISYTFSAGATLAPGAFVAIAKDRAAFLSRYPVAESMLAAGNFTGSLDNSGERLALTLPEPWQLNILRFRYEPAWQPAAAGGGFSLATLDAAASLPGDWDEPGTWAASPATGGTPGSDGVVASNPDTDGDGLPNDWETLYGLDPGSAADAALDRDGDGQSNLAEYLAGTDPASSASILAIRGVNHSMEGISLLFEAVPGKKYQVQASKDCEAWEDLGDVLTAEETEEIEMVIPAPTAGLGTTRFYRVCIVP